jgi:4,5-DOPA dioxygenase extradiol
MPSAVDATSGPLPTYFIGHAGVNLLFDERPNIAIVQDNLRAIGKEIQSLSPKPRAIIVFSGHFESREIHGPNVIEGTLVTA